MHTSTADVKHETQICWWSL